MAKKQMNPEPELWERQTGESSVAYEAFKEYRDMPGKRSVTAVAKKLKKSNTLMYRWEIKWFWQERAQAYDNKIEREKLAKKIKERDEMYDRHAQLSQGIQNLAARALQQWAKKADKNQGGNPEILENLSLRDIGYLTKIATDLDRLSRNEQIELEKMRTVESGEAVNAEGGVVVYVPEILPEESYEMDEEDEE